MSKKNNKIFVFNIGLEKNVKHIKEKINLNKYDLEIGPSKEEHKELMKIDFYRKAFDSKLFSPCSDVWRFYKLSKEKGLYIDTTVKIGKNFDEFYDFASKYDTFLVKVSDLYLNVPVIYGNNSYFFKECLDFLKKFKYDDDLYKFCFGPSTATLIATKNNMLYENNFEEQFFKEKNVMFGSVNRITDKKTILKYGGGSWFKGSFKWLNKISARMGWKKMKRDFNKKIPQNKNENAYKKIEFYLEKYFK